MLDMPAAIDLGRDALLLTVLICAPILAAGIVVGITISLVQTITQIQDQTLSIVPKIFAMFAAAVLFVPWLATRLIEYTQQILSQW